MRSNPLDFVVIASLLVSVSTLPLPPAAPGDAVVVRTDLGDVQGISANGTNRFLGIPYAKPPVGLLRFAAPEAALPYSVQPFLARTWGPGCPQRCKLPEGACSATFSEDCLTLNVYSPQEQSGPLPVMVWIHGGRYVAGAGGVPLYDGQALSQLGLVVVSLNYRLGILGFLATTDGLEGNFALQDQRVALQWVQRNIAAFGGDPNRVTIAGQSAGAYSVAAHLASPLSAGLFHKASMFSWPSSIGSRTRRDAESLGHKVTKKLGCHRSSATSCLRSKSVDDILDAQFDLSIPLWPNTLHSFMPWLPTIGGSDLPDQPFYMIRDGKAHDVPILHGSMSKDAQLFIYGGFNASVDYEEYKILLAAVFGVKEKLVKREYKPSTTHHALDDRPVMVNMTTDFIFECPTRYISTVSIGRSPVYVYEWRHAPSFDAIGHPFCLHVACHGSELPFIFGTGSSLALLQPEELQLQADATASFARFVSNAADGNMSFGGVAWPQWDASQQPWLAVEANGTSIVPGFKKKDCDFWDQQIGW
jgi:carboxylesterase type B